MNHRCFLENFKPAFLRPVSVASALMAGFTLVACGGGGGEQVVPEAVVTGVASAKSPQLLEGSSADSQDSVFEYEVTLNKAVERSLTLSISSGSTLSAGASTGRAKGGSECVGDVDFAFPSTVTFAAGSGNPGSASKLKITVKVCKDDVFEPNEAFQLAWASPGSTGGSLEGTIVNDDAGGLNSTGSTSLLTGLTAFGRDTSALTNASADGALGFSFDKSTECVLDKVTGLKWQKLPGKSMTFADLTAYVASVNDLKLCGHKDWRVPTANELLNLMDISKSAASIANADYSGVVSEAMSGTFWSSDERAAIGAVDAWMVDASNNGLFSLGNKTTTRNVRLVRGDQPVTTACDNSNGRFVDLLDGKISDSRTGLMWKKCPEGKTGDACTGSALQFSSAKSVADQLAQANTTGDKGYSDWRVPTRNELASLVNHACNNPSILGGIFPSNEAKPYITSSLNANNPGTQIWYVDFSEGHVGTNFLTGGYFLRLVRAGQ